MKRIVLGIVLLVFPAAVAGQTVVKKEPASGALRQGQVVLVDDGSCPADQIKEVTGGKSEDRVKQMRRCVAKK